MHSPDNLGSKMPYYALMLESFKPGGGAALVQCKLEKKSYQITVFLLYTLLSKINIKALDSWGGKLDYVLGLC